MGWKELGDALGGVATAIERVRGEFFAHDWTPRAARLELKKIERALQQQANITRPDSLGTFAYGLFDFFHASQTGSHEFAYTLFPKADLLAMADFLREVLDEKGLGPPPADPIKQRVDRVATQVRTTRALRAAEEQMVQENPEEEAHIRRLFRKYTELMEEEV